MRIFQHCPLMSQWSHYHHITAFSEFLAYKTRVPVRGAILLNQDLDEVVLVKGWKKGASWSFPRGKINKDEKDLDCAIREVYEETGFDIREAGLVDDEENMKFIEITMREQHMRLYVFRGVPTDIHFEPRTRKEISKIEWYKLSELPTLQKNKLNANKFYMVAPFLHPLKKWIAQQRKPDVQARSVSAPMPLTDGETSMEEATHSGAGALTPERELVEAATPSDLPEVTPTQYASGHLRRLLNIGSPATSEPRLPSGAQSSLIESDSSKSNALLAFLRHGTSIIGNQSPENRPVGTVQAPLPMAASSTPLQDISLFAAFPGSSKQPRNPAQSGHPHAGGQMLQSCLPASSSSVHATISSHIPISRAADSPQGSVPAQPQVNRDLPRMPLLRPSMTFSNLPNLRQQSHPSVPFDQVIGSGSQPWRHPALQQSPAPYQQTGDPQFAQPLHGQAVRGPTVPPANKLPPPKLNSHSLALLNMFKNEAHLSRTSGLDVGSKAEPGPTSARKVSIQQDHLLSILKGTAVGSSTSAAELSAHPAPSFPRQILQRSGVIENLDQPTATGKKRQEDESLTSATVSGPLKTPQFETDVQSASNGTPRKMDKGPPVPASPVTILPRSSGASRDSPVSAEPVSAPRILPVKARAPEQPRPFQPQILRRSEKVDLDMILPSRTVTVHEFSQNQPDVADSPVPVPSEKSPVLPNYDRRPNQPAAQKETLLALFGKTPAQTPVTRAAESPSATRPSVASATPSEKASHHRGGVAPVTVPGHTSSVKSDSEAPVTTSSDNKAFLLGFLEEVAKGKK